MRDEINIFIPAAGRGERLRPVTDHIPKPLVPVLGKPVLQHILEKVSALPFKKIGINIHHKKEAVEEWVSRCRLKDRIVLFPEETMLGTGGALRNAEGLLKERTFVVHNSDVLSDIDIGRLLEHHRSSGNHVTLAVHDYPEFNNLSVSGQGLLRQVNPRAGAGAELMAFTGVAVYEPEFLRFLPGGASSVTDAWMSALNAGCRIGTFDTTGCYWTDIGRPAAYASAVFRALRNDGEAVYIHPSVRGCTNIDLQGYVVIESGCMLGRGVSLKNCILLQGTCIGTGAEEVHGQHRLENCIMGPGFRTDISEPEPAGCREGGGQLIGDGGSDRKFYRLRKGNESVVLMQCSGDDPDFERHMEYTRFFRRHSVPVPGLIKADAGRKQAVFEDAGDISLYSYLKCPREEAETENIYRRVIDLMIMLHIDVTAQVQECTLLRERIFDYGHLRWETDYFISRFVKGLRNTVIENPSGLEREFHRLALRVDSFPKAVIHRDLQSRNIMVMKGGEIRLIDFQGARMGPPAYDAASILWDPYHRLQDDMRDRLIRYYIEETSRRSEGTFDGDRFRDALLPCRLQRHMQALGAYGFLSSVKGKKYFLKHVPEALRLLKEDISQCSDDYPELHKLILTLAS
ncbi:MAG: phosphotransferase [Deferribacteres bacterium]|nr:phosphotransferase [Deferribacteres bacterium]